MNFKRVLCILLFLVCSNVFAQQIKIQSFTVPNTLWNATTKTLTVNRSNNSTFLTPILMSRPTSTEWIGKPIDAEVEFTVHKNNSSSTIVQNIKFVTSDFIGNTGISVMRSHIVNVPHGFIGEAGGYLTVKWRYNKQNYPWPDNNGNGWTDWYTLNFEVNLKLSSIEQPPTTFNGPSTICDEGSYLLTDPGTITLENASGIATLTKINDNTYKVTRVGNAYGNVFLQSVVESKTYKKEITVGLGQPEINGPNDAIYNQEFLVTCSVDPLNSINWTTAGLPEGSTVTNISHGVIKVKLPIKNASHPNTGYFSIYATVTGCGSIMATKHINYTSTGAPGPGDDGGPEL